MFLNPRAAPLSPGAANTSKDAVARLVCQRIPYSVIYALKSATGPTLAQEGTSVTYLLSVTSDKCSLVATGFQTDEKILCKAVAQKNATEIKFVSYEDGTLLNTYGVEIYKKDAALFSLQAKDKTIITHWLALVPDGVKKTTGVYFQAVH